MRTVLARATLALALVLALAGCGAPPSPSPQPAPAPPPAPPPQPAAPVDDLGGGAVGDLRSARFDLRLPLPDIRGWRIEDAREPWLTATHAASSTALLVRTWRADDRASRAACEAQARLWRDLPGGSATPLVEQRRIDVPPGFDTVVEIGVSEAKQPGQPASDPRASRPAPAEVSGFAVAFGGRARRCFAYVVTTRAAGPGAERQVAARLAAMVEVSLAGLRLESELVPVVPR